MKEAFENMQELFDALKLRLGSDLQLLRLEPGGPDLWLLVKDQWYPVDMSRVQNGNTPSALAKSIWRKFKDQNIIE